MRCFEIQHHCIVCCLVHGQTITWDVLKLSYKLRIYAVCRLNNNMRCFEIVNASYWHLRLSLNNNMRCFEINIGSVRSCPRSPLLLRFIICCLIRSAISWYSCLYCTWSAQMPMQVISAQALHGSIISAYRSFFSSDGFLWSFFLHLSNKAVILSLFFLIPVPLPSRTDTSHILSDKQLSLIRVIYLYNLGTDNLYMPLCINSL